MLGLSLFKTALFCRSSSGSRLPGKTLSVGGNNSSAALWRDGGLKGAGEVSLIAHRLTLAHTHESKTREREYALESEIRLPGSLAN